MVLYNHSRDCQGFEYNFLNNLNYLIKIPLILPWTGWMAVGGVAGEADAAAAAAAAAPAALVTLFGVSESNWNAFF